jgi:hypothetical protein
MKAQKTKSISELVEIARAWGLSGYAGLKKSELAKLLAGGLKGRTITELTATAREWGMVGLSRLRKQELVKKLRTSLLKLTQANAKPARKKKTSAKALPKKTAKVSRRSSKKKTERVLVSKTKKPPSKGDGKKSVRIPEEVCLPDGYHDGRMVLLPRDPDWLYCYWDPTPEQQRQLDDEQGMPAIRVIRIEDGEKMLIQPVPISHAARSWYFQVSNPAGAYKAELGLLDEKGRFEPIMSSNLSSLPPSAVSDRLASSFASHGDGEQRDNTIGPAHEVDRKLAAKLQALSAGVEGSGMDSARALETRKWMEEIGSTSVGHKTDD